MLAERGEEMLNRQEADRELELAEKRTDGNQKWQDYEDGWYIYSYISNKDKIRVLNRLSDDLHLGLIIKEEHLIL